jgi:hypothetical protein
MAGALLAVAFSVLGVIPICGFAALPQRLFAYAFGGFLAGRMAIQSGYRNRAAVAGLGAGILAGIVDGLANIALAPVRFNLAGDTMTSLHLLPQGIIEVFANAGMDLMRLDTAGGSLFFSVLLCGVIWLAGGMMGALGGGLASAVAE